VKSLVRRTMSTRFVWKILVRQCAGSPVRRVRFFIFPDLAALFLEALSDNFFCLLSLVCFHTIGHDQLPVIFTNFKSGFWSWNAHRREDFGLHHYFFRSASCTRPQIKPRVLLFLSKVDGEKRGSTFPLLIQSVDIWMTADELPCHIHLVREVA